MNLPFGGIIWNTQTLPILLESFLARRWNVIQNCDFRVFLVGNPTWKWKVGKWIRNRWNMIKYGEIAVFWNQTCLWPFLRHRTANWWSLSKKIPEVRAKVELDCRRLCCEEKGPLRIWVWVKTYDFPHWKHVSLGWTSISTTDFSQNEGNRLHWP